MIEMADRLSKSQQSLRGTKITEMTDDQLRGVLTIEDQSQRLSDWQ